MEVLPTRLDGPVLMSPDVHADARGFFIETFRSNRVADAVGVDAPFVQDNHSRSVEGVVRGMHFQLDPPAAKLVRCARGAVVDVVVDVRAESPTFGEWEAFHLDDENLRLLYIPAGFAHGFCVVSPIADVMYKQTAYWSPAADMGISPADPEVAIDWPVPPAQRIVSDRDRSAPRLSELRPLLSDHRSAT